jgi:hypothetical protein
VTLPTWLVAVLKWLFAAFVNVESTVVGKLTGAQWLKFGAQFTMYLIPFVFLGHLLVGGWMGFFVGVLFSAIAVIPQIIGQWWSDITTVFVVKEPALLVQGSAPPADAIAAVKREPTEIRPAYSDTRSTIA